MGKNLLKADLLAEIKKERTKLLTLVGSIPKKEFNKPGMNSANWSIKDVLTHLVDWEQRVVSWCLDGKNGETPEVPGDGFSWSQTRQLNELIQKRHARKSIKKVLEELGDVHLSTQALIQSLSDQELNQLNHFDWTGKSWTVSDYLRGNTASHYKWATAKIKKWRKVLNSSD